MNQPALHSILMVSLAKLAESLHARIDILVLDHKLTQGEAQEEHQNIEDTMDLIVSENQGRISMALIDDINRRIVEKY